jgi:hypothetical protein
MANRATLVSQRKGVSDGHNLESLLKTVQANRCVVVRLTHDQFYHFIEREAGGKGFTIALPHGLVEDVRAHSLHRPKGWSRRPRLPRELSRWLPRGPRCEAAGNYFWVHVEDPAFKHSSSDSR